MSKAYDRVNLGMLYKALLRLRLPNNFIELISSLFAFRFNQVLTTHGITPTYPVLSGIDQGEILSPILWCIYFDPLLCRVQNTTLGYNMNVTSPFNHGNIESHHSLSTHVPALAYMDNTLWLSQSKESLNSMLRIADSFYELNSIQVNWTKSTLLSPFKNQNAVHFQLPTSALNIIPAKYNSSIRYLGIWISISNNKQFIQKQVQLDLHTATQALRPKVLTDKQIIYIYNIVILPKIMYRMQLTFLGHKACDKFMGSFRRILKTKLSLSNNTPIAAFHTPLVYNLTHLFDCQIQDKTAALYNISNNKGLIGLTSNIRILQLQILEWLPTSPLNSWPHDDSAPFKDWIAALLSTLKKWNLEFKAVTPMQYNVIGGSLPIYTQFSQNNYRKIIDVLRKKNLIFCDQLISSDRTFLYTYADTKIYDNRRTPIRTPKWFTKLELSLNINTTRRLSTPLHLTHSD